MFLEISVRLCVTWQRIFSDRSRPWDGEGLGRLRVRASPFHLGNFSPRPDYVHINDSLTSKRRLSARALFDPYVKIYLCRLIHAYYSLLSYHTSHYHPFTLLFLGKLLCSLLVCSALFSPSIPHFKYQKD